MYPAWIDLTLRHVNRVVFASGYQTILIIVITIGRRQTEKRLLSDCFASLPYTCRRNRALSPGSSPYEVVVDTLKLESDSASFDLLNTENEVLFSAELVPLESKVTRIKIKEKNPIRERYEVKGALVAEPVRVK